VFGKVDENIKGGLTVEKAAEIILKAIMLKRHEIIVGNLFY